MADEDEEEQGEGDEGGATIAEEGKGDADDRDEAEHHANIDEEMEEKDGGDGIAIEARKGGALPFGQKDEPDEQQHIGCHNNQATHETPFFAHGAENKVGLLLGYEVGLGDGAIEEALAHQTA